MAKEREEGLAESLGKKHAEHLGKNMESAHVRQRSDSSKAWDGCSAADLVSQVCSEGLRQGPPRLVAAEAEREGSTSQRKTAVNLMAVAGCGPEASV